MSGIGETLHMDTMSLGDLKTKAGQKMNFLQKALKALSDVFIEIMPGILAAALLTGLSSVLGNMKAVESNETLYGIARLINIRQVRFLVSFHFVSPIVQ